MSDEMHQSKDNKAIPMTSVSSGKGREVRKDVYYYTNQIVNVVMVGEPGQGSWVLIDAGMPKSAKEIISVAADRFGGENGPPNYLTTDWPAAWESVRKLETLLPVLVVSGHGQAMEGEELAEGLRNLVQNFDKVAIPDHGKYVNNDHRSS